MWEVKILTFDPTRRPIYQLGFSNKAISQAYLYFPLLYAGIRKFLLREFNAFLIPSAERKVGDNIQLMKQRNLLIIRETLRSNASSTFKPFLTNDILSISFSYILTVYRPVSNVVLIVILDLAPSFVVYFISYTFHSPLQFL